MKSNPCAICVSASACIRAVLANPNMQLPEAGKPVYAEFRFEMSAAFDYAAFFADSTKVSEFKEAVKAQMAVGLRIAATRISINNVYKGSIVVELSIDTADLTTNQLLDVVGLIQYQPASLFTTTFLNTWGVTGVTAKIVKPAAAGLNIPAIVGGVVGGVGGAAVIGGATWFILKKRRAAGVEPRANRGPLLSDNQQC